MKVALSTDTLLKRDHCTEIYDLMCEIFPEAEAYTLAHKPGQILGPAEQRIVHSSFLTNKVQELENLGKYFFSIPGAAKNLFIPCSNDVIINISRGLSHGIKKCEKTYQITYLYDEYWFDKKRDSIMEFLFGGMVRNYALNSLKQVDELWVGSQKLYDELKDRHSNIHLVEPFFKIHEFPVIKSPTFTYDYFLIDTADINDESARELISFFEKENLKYKFVGEDKDLKALSEKNSFGDRCAGELAPMLSGSHALITFNQSSFPLIGLQALSTGREVFAINSEANKNYFNTKGVSFFENIEELKKLTSKKPNLEEGFSKELNHSVKKYNGSKFKHLVNKAIDRIKNEEASSTDQDCC